MMTSIVVLNIHMSNFNLRSSEYIIKNDAQKKMVEYGVGRKFNDFIYFEVGFFSYTLNLVHT